MKVPASMPAAIMEVQPCTSRPQRPSPPRAAAGRRAQRLRGPAGAQDLPRLRRVAQAAGGVGGAPDDAEVPAALADDGREGGPGGHGEAQGEAGARRGARPHLRLETADGDARGRVWILRHAEHASGLHKVHRARRGPRQTLQPRGTGVWDVRRCRCSCPSSRASASLLCHTPCSPELRLEVGATRYQMDGVPLVL